MSGYSEIDALLEKIDLANDTIERLEVQNQNLRAGLAPFAEAWKIAVDLVGNAPLGTINVVAAYHLKGSAFQQAARVLEVQP